jgi:hypothetical protein
MGTVTNDGAKTINTEGEIVLDDGEGEVLWPWGELLFCR